jgi:hypothetical protein
MRKLPVKERTPFNAPTKIVWDCVGYIAWLDSKLVIFYTSDLLFSPTKPILDGTDDEAIRCVRGLGKFD